MYKKRGNTLFSLLLALLFVITTIAFGQPVTVSAANKTLVHVQSKNAESLEVNRFTFKITTASDLELNVYVPAPTGVTLTLRDNSGNVLGNPMVLTSYASSWILDGRGWYTYKYVIDQLQAGSYSIDYVFDQETKFDAKIVQLASTVTLNSDKLVITKGFTKTLNVNNGTAASWASSDLSVASVNSKGVIKGKKAGHATITARLKDGTKLKCNVTVKTNVYSAKKITLADTGINECMIRAYHATYRSNGDLVIKFRIANGTNTTLTAIPGFHISVINQKNNGIASYSRNSYQVNVPAQSVKGYTVTIKKHAITGKKADLRNTKFEISGQRIKL